MPIEINGLSSTKIQGLQTDNQQKQAVEQRETQPNPGKSSAVDTVSLSDNALQLGKLDSAADSTPVVDAQRVEEVRQAINNGSYKVDADAVADKLMQFESILKS